MDFGYTAKPNFVSDYAVYKIKPGTNDLHFPVAIIAGFIGGKEGQNVSRAGCYGYPML